MLTGILKPCGVDAAVLTECFGCGLTGGVEVAEFEVGTSGAGEVEEAVAYVTGGAVLGLLGGGEMVQGGSELGPRALGGRSILADPRTTTSPQTLNNRIKHREPFRPFAPAVLADHAADWFELDVPSPFMLLAPLVRPDRADKIAGAVHVDRTARVQTVDPAAAPAFAAPRGCCGRRLGRRAHRGGGPAAPGRTPVRPSVPTS